MARIVANAPGRVNLIGDHVDYAGGWALPIAIELAITLEAERGGDVVELTSAGHAGTARLPLDPAEPAAVDPAWARHAAGVLAEVRPGAGLRGHLSSTLPVGAGLSSSAAVEVALALALLGPPVPTGAAMVELAHLCRRAEERAVGVPCGVMDQLASLGGAKGCALLIDFTDDTVRHVPIPPAARLAIVDSEQRRTLEGSRYAERRREVEAAADAIGPLRDATTDEVASIADPVVRRRARHVVTENRRVHDLVAAFEAGDLEAAGRVMDDAHASLRDDHEVSTPAIDRLVADVRAAPGVYGARLTGGGWGGFVVALTEPGSTVGRTVRAAAGATVEEVA